MGKRNKDLIALERLKEFEPVEGYYLAFSGGKDSIVIKQLAKESGVKFDAHYSVTTIDPPELIYFIRDHHADVIFDRPEIPFLTRLPKKGFPLRHRRWCCDEYKKRGGHGRKVLTGIRADESNQRKNRRMVEICLKDMTRTMIHPIIDWTEKDVWNFIEDRKLPYCSLYDEGWKRLGCLFCPMDSKENKKKVSERYPNYTRAFIRSFEKLYQDRKTRGLTSVDRWPTGRDMFYWWISNSRG